MDKIRYSESALLFVGTLYSEPSVFSDAKERLEKFFGDILLVSQPLPWDYSIYYKEELGSPITRQFIFFKRFIDAGTLSDFKLETIDIEDDLSLNGKRRINLDPGYLTLSKVVLASTKNYSHRLYLGKGIYGEVTLLYQNGTFRPHIFTYRDYQDQNYINLFLSVRSTLKKMRNENKELLHN